MPLPTEMVEAVKTWALGHPVLRDIDGTVGLRADVQASARREQRSA